MGCLVSVIVPVYNVEKYLDKCLYSLVNQTLKDIEIIVVNDGTKDNSQDIIDKYVLDYPNKIVPILKENGGLSDARNCALDYVTGKYISFIDSDDYVDITYFEDMYGLAKKDDLDLVISDLEYVWENNIKKTMIKEGLNERANSDIQKALFLSPLSVCNKLFKRDLFEELELKFYKDLWYEDIPVDLLYCANAKKIGRNTKSKYHYLQRASSILGSSYSPKMNDLFIIFEKVIVKFKEVGLYECYYSELEYLYIEHFLVYGAFRFLRTTHYQELMSKAFDFVRNEFNNYPNNKYISNFNFKNRLFLATHNKVTMKMWHYYLSNNTVYVHSESNVFVSNIAPKRSYSNTNYDLNLSIIVPVYNVEKYLHKCLSSLVNQNMDNYEIIVVNDGTKDDSQTIIDDFVDRYPALIRAFVKTNGGLSDARNYGVKRAKGKYISFLDSDDFVNPGFYSGMYRLADENDLDLVVSDLEYVWEKNDKRNMKKEGLFGGYEEINKVLFLSPLFAWNKLYRKELFFDLKCEYPRGLWYEDIPVTLSFFANAGRIGYYDEVGVNYLQRSSSILGSGYSLKMFDIFKVYQLVVDSFKESGLFETYRDEFEYLYIEHFLVYGAFRFLRTDEYKDLMSKAFDFVKEEFPRYSKNKYIKNFGIKNKLFLLSNNKRTMKLWHLYLTKK